MRTIVDEERLKNIQKICGVLETYLDKVSNDDVLDVGEHIYITHYLLMYSLTIADAMQVSQLDIATMLQRYNDNYSKNYFTPIVKPPKYKPSGHLEVVKTDDNKRS